MRKQCHKQIVSAENMHAHGKQIHLQEQNKLKKRGVIEVNGDINDRQRIKQKWKTV
jgi:hypothetical protein